MDRFWLADYFPEAFAFDRRRGPSLQEVCATLGLDMDVVPLLVPHDCQDGFGGVYWRQPDAYLDPAVRAGISMLAQTEHERGDGLERLRRDLSEGTWAARHHALLDQTELDCGYRIVVGLTGAHAARKTVRYCGASAETLALTPECLDLLVSSLALHYVAGYGTLIQRIARWL